jgi:hypothetical protein
LVILPESLEYDDSVGMIAQELRQENGEQLIKKQTVFRRLAEAQSQQKVLWYLLERSFEYRSDSGKVDGVRKVQKLLDKVH